MSAAAPRVSVLVPTHDHASTLGRAVASALRQTVQDVEVIIIGDGVTEAVRDVALTLQRDDARVRFLDLPKGDHHGELHRHTAIEQSTGEVIAYLCDDDLLMPEHLADMLALLAEHDLAQSLNGYVDPSGDIGIYVGRLDDPVYVTRLLDPAKRFNFVGITGTAHTRAFYERAAAPWETTPADAFPDQHQWRRMLVGGAPARATTSDRLTVIALPTSQGGRDTWSPEQRAAELERWEQITLSPDGQDELDRLVGAGAVRQLNEWSKDLHELIDFRDEVRPLLAEEQQRRADAERRLANVTSSRWWRLGRRLRPGLKGREA